MSPFLVSGVGYQLWGHECNKNRVEVSTSLQPVIFLSAGGGGGGEYKRLAGGDGLSEVLVP